MNLWMNIWMNWWMNERVGGDEDGWYENRWTYDKKQSNES